MKRRTILAGAGTAIGGGALYWYLTNDSSGPSTPTPTPTPTANTPTKTPTPTPTPIGPGTGDPDKYVENRYSYFKSYSDSEVTLRITKDDINNRQWTQNQEVKINLFLSRYPDQNAQEDVWTTENFKLDLKNGFDKKIEISNEKIPTDEDLFFFAFLSNKDGSVQEFIAETDPFTYDGENMNEFEPEPTQETSVNDNKFTRINYDGLYVVRVWGDSYTNNQYNAEFPVRKSNYVKVSGLDGTRRVTAAQNIMSSFSIAYSIVFAAKTFSDVPQRQEAIDSAIAAVRSLPGTPDKVSSGIDTNNGKYPRQTLVDGEGDIAEMAVLLSGLLGSVTEYNALFFSRNHAAVGITGEYEGHFRQNQDSPKYYSIEITQDLPIGEVPKKVEELGMRVFPVQEVN